MLHWFLLVPLGSIRFYSIPLDNEVGGRVGLDVYSVRFGSIRLFSIPIDNKIGGRVGLDVYLVLFDSTR